ncbi:lymphocyte activation gene 3 protein-like [Cheilinus undulatus]|uniref:lymphocyte activation gene 3 protein-like n=1 Tax=Cheilinus undulatus TaxID=241271 RepID=UPI001BD6209C|nr:lymphocyte activation gene 3 protein-like [Cheilinus undulatus]
MILLEFFILGMITFFMKGGQCELTEVFAEAGSQAVLPCKCDPSSTYPHAVIWTKANKGTVWRKQKSGLQYWGSGWTRNGTQRAQCFHSQFERGDYSLQINSVRMEDGGMYSCKITQGSQLTENVVMLRIMKVRASPLVPIWGKDVTITCDVTPYPDGATLRWTLNNSPFVPSTETTPPKVVKEEATLRINGKWTCVVEYKGKEAQASATLAVKGIIKPSEDSTKLYAAVGSDVYFPCVLSPGLIPSSSAWERIKPGSLFRANTLPLPASFSTSSPPSKSPYDISASMKEVKVEDEGRYRCSVTIEGQQLTRYMQLLIAKIERSVVSKKKGSVALTCKLTDTSEITGYEWVHVAYDLNGTQSVGSPQKGKTLTINEMSEENRGEWVCRFYGKQGMLGNVTYHLQLMSGLTGEKQARMSQNTTVIVGLSILLLILLLILAQMYKNHRRRKRIFQFPALETIVHAASNEREERERNRVKK